MFCLHICFFIILYCSYSFAEETTDTVQAEYASALLEKAENKKLHEDDYWLLLGHYKKTIRGYISRVDDDTFFLAENGKSDPHAELRATIRSFFQEPIPDEEHPSFRFIARFNWLHKKLDIDLEKLPYDPFPDFNAAYENIAPSNIYLLFPSGYIESPASMFGHTLLLIEQEHKSWLQSRAVNYAAITDESFGLTFAFKGLFGLYKGKYSFLEYYKKIMDYNSIENRDIWEYKLDFTEQEKIRLMMHIFELEEIYSNYYFTNENCSFNLLFLLEAARPEFELVEKYRYFCEPIDTIREIIEQDGVEFRRYRPSKYSKIKWLSQKLDREQQNYIISISRGKEQLSSDALDALSHTADDTVIMLDLMAEYCQFLLTKDKINLSQYRSIYRQILRERSKIDVEDSGHLTVAEPMPPEDSHYSRKVAVGGGTDSHGHYGLFQFRLTNNTLMDYDTGLNNNSQLIFGRGELRLYPEDSTFRLKRFDIINLTSINPGTRFIYQNSIFFDTGIVYDYVNSALSQSQYTYFVDSGFGPAFQLKWCTFFIFPRFYTSFARAYNYKTDLQPGARSGLIFEAGQFKAKYEFNYYHSVLINDGARIANRMDARLAFSRNTYALGTYEHVSSISNNSYDFSLQLQRCF